MMDLTSPDYALRWPPALFVPEARRVVKLRNPQAAEILLLEALRNGQEIAAAHSNAIEGLERVVAHADELQLETDHRPFWSERTQGSRPPILDVLGVARRVANLIRDLHKRGYFDRDLPFDCIDDPDRYRDPSDYIEERTGWEGCWPLKDIAGLASNTDMMFDIIEVLHDIAARPVNGYYHSYGQCGWHYSIFNGELGRRIYRWSVNRVLDQSSLRYRLAEDGEDIGRLVAVTDDAREGLAQSMVQRSGPSQDRIEHAIALFRARGSTRDDKRSAVKNLADVLEDRRKLLKTSLMTKDESVLFQIANQFDIRHHAASQRADYDPVFLDWVFWWYLATIELTDRLLASQGKP